MSNIKVVDVNNEEGKEEVVEEPVAIEETACGSLNSNKVGVETKEEVIEPNNEIVNEEVNEEEVKEEPKPKAKAKPKASDKVNCKTCDRSMTYKNYRYRHEKLCTEETQTSKASC